MEERRKARYLAMRQAVETIERSEPGTCSSCAAQKERHATESRRLQMEIEMLRGAVSKMAEQLAGFMTGTNLRSFLQRLRVDSRLFTVHGGGDFYGKGSLDPNGSMAAPNLDDVEDPTKLVAERDLARLKLATVGRELAELKGERQELERQVAEQRETAAERSRRVDEADARLRALESQRCVAGSPGSWARAPEGRRCPPTADSGNGPQESVKETASKDREPKKLEEMEARISTLEEEQDQPRRRIREKVRSLVSTPAAKEGSDAQPSNLRPLAVKWVGDLAPFPEMHAATLKKSLQRTSVPLEWSRGDDPSLGGRQLSHPSLVPIGQAEEEVALSRRRVLSGSGSTRRPKLSKG